MKPRLWLKNPLMILAVLLPACSMPQEHFDCPVKEGLGCLSVSEVNHLINQKKVGDTSYDFNEPYIPSQKEGRLWIAPYVDEEGLLRPAYEEPF